MENRLHNAEEYIAFLKAENPDGNLDDNLCFTLHENIYNHDLVLVVDK